MEPAPVGGADGEPDPVAVPLSVLAPDAPGTKLRVEVAVDGALAEAASVGGADGEPDPVADPLSVLAPEAPGTWLSVEEADPL